ncbi:MAG: ABC transporter substrate-binding protein [Candidatus Lambdaproteobacteria bacterium]|nr:ABC transporter substrate-binding protein [Candidatus Lambdaproteobacteria bacterium]
MNLIRATAAALLGGLLVAAAIPATAQKYGGVLRVQTDANPPSLSLHEESTNRTTWPMVPVYGNLVWFDYFNPKEDLDSIRPDMAERWEWSADNRTLTFTLRPGLRWHDGKPLTAKDVQHTFEMVRGRTTERLKLNPRKLWYANVQGIETVGDLQVSFRLTKPQPSLLAILAGSYSPIYPSHIPAADLRKTAVGTGPFKLKSYTADQSIVLEKNPDFHVKGRPYLDGVTFHMIRTIGSTAAALLKGQVDAAHPTFTTKPAAENLRRADPTLQFAPLVASGSANLLLNAKKPPLNNPKLKRAVGLAMDRENIIKSVYQNGAVLGGAMIPQPWGGWGLTEEQLRMLPGYGTGEKDKAEARRLLAEEGYGPDNPLKLVITTRTAPTYQDLAVWASGELKAVGIEAVLKTIDTGQWFPLVARREFQLAANSTGLGLDDPDAVFFEHYGCGSQRNYTDFCNAEVQQLFERQSAELDIVKRRQFVQEADMRLQQEVARPVLAYRMYYHPHRSYVKNWIPHPVSVNGWRFTEVWLDR